MELALLLARILLAAVFVVSGLAKLADAAGSRQAMRDFGVPTMLAGPAGGLLPLAELAVAVALLLSGMAAWAGAIGALALLLIFTAGIGVNLARGRKPDCHCFGQIAPTPIGINTVVRNTVLAVIAAFVVVEGRTYSGASALEWIGHLPLCNKLASSWPSCWCCWWRLKHGCCCNCCGRADECWCSLRHWSNGLRWAERRPPLAPPMLRFRKQCRQRGFPWGRRRPRSVSRDSWGNADIGRAALQW